MHRNHGDRKGSGTWWVGVDVRIQARMGGEARPEGVIRTVWVSIKNTVYAGKTGKGGGGG